MRGRKRERERERQQLAVKKMGNKDKDCSKNKKKKKAIKSAAEERCTFKYQFEQIDWCKAHAQLHYGKHQRKFCLSGSEKAESSQNVRRRRHSLLRNNHNLQVTSGNHISGQSAGQLDCSCSGIFSFSFCKLAYVRQLNWADCCKELLMKGERGARDVLWNCLLFFFFSLGNLGDL